MDLMQRRRELMAMEVNNLKCIGEYTVTEPMENDNTGNALLIWNNIVYPYCQNEPLESVIIVDVINNTSRSPYALKRMICFATEDVASVGAVLRANDTLKTINTGAGAYCAVGTIIKIYKAM